MGKIAWLQEQILELVMQLQGSCFMVFIIVRVYSLFDFMKLNIIDQP